MRLLQIELLKEMWHIYDIGPTSSEHLSSLLKNKIIQSDTILFLLIIFLVCLQGPLVFALYPPRSTAKQSVHDIVSFVDQEACFKTR